MPRLAIALVYLLLALCVLGSGVGILNLKDWGRKLFVLLATFAVLETLINAIFLEGPPLSSGIWEVLFLIIALYFVTRSRVKDQFRNDEVACGSDQPHRTPPPVPTGEALPGTGSFPRRIKKQRRYVAALVVLAAAVVACLLFIVPSADFGDAVEVTHQWKFERERFHTSIALILDLTNRSSRNLWLLPSHDDPLSSETRAEAKKETQQLRLLYSDQAVDQLEKDMKDIYWLQVAIKKGESWVPSQYS